MKQEQIVQLFLLQPGSRRALTLVEMLVAMAITLVMMAAVTTIFANLSNSVTNRRASMEMTSALRHARGVLHRDLAGATCPGATWQSPDANHGYIEIIEGPQSDFDPSIWLRDRDNDGVPDDVDAGGPLEPLDLATSTLPSSNLGRLPGSTTLVTAADSNVKTDGRALGDWDDTLMLTVRNEREPFVGRVPAAGVGVNAFPAWGFQSIESPLAEVVWFAVENQIENPDTNLGGSVTGRPFYFAEPGFRTVYRRTLLIAPWLNYQFRLNVNGGAIVTGPGVARVLPASVDAGEVDQAIAGLIAFQSRYDLSVRLEWNPTWQRWVLMANSLADLTKRENRYGHIGFNPATNRREFPYAAISSGGGGVSGAIQQRFDPDIGAPATPATGRVIVDNNRRAGDALHYLVEDIGIGYADPPFAFATGGRGATVRAILDESNQIVAFTTGFAPLGGVRRGEDVMLTDALAFDLKIYDPHAPLVEAVDGSVLNPGDEGWRTVVATGLADNDGNTPFVVDRGAFIDLAAWWQHRQFASDNAGITAYNPADNVWVPFLDGSVFMTNPDERSQLRPNFAAGTVFVEPYRVWCSWSTHYENNGLNEDNDFIWVHTDPTNPNAVQQQPYIDEGTDGFDMPEVDVADPANRLTIRDIGTLGPDDLGERETEPPYDAPLRGVQVTLRAYELDSRQVREVKVSRSFVPK